ncbi:MAG TPA: transporter [Campylobacterales bacterium]|nr:transporter [Campylobacterales bacterium]
MDIVVSISSIYFFILLGWLSKVFLKAQIDEKSLVLLSIYFLQPMLVFWGLTTQEIDLSVVQAPLLFFLVIMIALSMSFLVVNYLFKEQKDRSIATVASIVGNTGNLGIPLGIALFGEGSILYTSIINLANLFIVNTVGVYFYARGEFSARDAFIKIFKLPAIWFGFLALLFNAAGLKIPENLSLSLEMGAYTTMVLQLFIFGMYLYSVKISDIDKKLITFVTVMKFVAIPLLAIMILQFFTLSDMVYNVILLELLVPLAVMNVNLAALYDCRVNQVTFLVFSSSFIFLGYLFFVLGLFR